MKKTLLSVLLAASSISFAQWTQLPIDGGELRDFTPTPTGYLVASEGGVFKSTNNGATWSYSSNGLFAADSSISCEHFAKTATALFVQTNNGIAKSTNDGNSWVSAGNTGISGNMGNFTSLISVSNKLYTCKYTNTMNTYQIYTSTDDGANWTPGANVYSNNDRPALFNIGGTVYVTKQDSIFTTATGASLTPMNYTGFPTTGKTIETLSGDGTYLYAGFQDGGNGAGFYRYDISGSNWQQITSGIAPFAFATGPHLVGTTLYASVLTMSMALQTYTSATQGSSWTQTAVTGMSADFIDKVYSLGGSDMLGYNPIDGLCFSSNNGISWAPKNVGFRSMVYREQRNLVYSNGNLITTSDLGINSSSNGGSTWAPAVNGIPASLHLQFSIYNANNTLYTTFFDIGGKYMYKSTDGAANWTAVTYPASGEDVEFWSHSNTAVFVKMTNNATYKSVNSGANWIDITANLNSSYNYNTPMVFDGTALYIYGTSGSGNQIFKSVDDGANWTTVSNTGLPTTNVYIAKNLFVNGNTLMSMWADYSGFPYSYKMSTYTGSGWNTVTVAGLPPNLVSSCSNCGGNGTYENDWYSYNSNIYYMANRGLFISYDNGATFTQYNNGFYPGVNTKRLVTDGTSLYAGTEGNSIWKVSVPTGIKTTKKSESYLELYPNPATDHVTVSFSKNVIDATSKLIITNMLGAVVQETSIPTTTTNIDVNTSNLKSGVYFYSITSASKKSVAQKLVINH